MADAALITPYPFATVEDLKERWQGFPAGGETTAQTLLEDASQFIIDQVPAAETASPRTRLMVTCAVVRRAMQVEDKADGYESHTLGTGPFQFTGKLANPHGDFYLTRQEKKSLGDGKFKAFGANITGGNTIVHRPWCNLMWNASYCSCGADIAGTPIYEGG